MKDLQDAGGNEERRVRAEQVAQSNEALARTSARLVQQPDLPSVLHQVVIEAVTQLNAAAGHLAIFDEANDTLQTYAHFQVGESPNTHYKAEPRPAGEAPYWRLIVNLGGPRYFDFEQETELFWPQAIEYHREQAHKSVLGVPLFAGDKPLGHLGFAFNDIHTISQEQSEFLAALAHQAVLAIQLTRLAEEASDKARQAAIADERNRMAREIHDTLAQIFTGVAMHLEAARALVPSESKAQFHIAQAREQAREGLQEARRSVRALRLRPLQDSDLCGALQKVVSDCDHTEPPRVRLSIEGKACPLPAHVENDLLRVAQEALLNAVRHAEAQNIVIELVFLPLDVRLSVRDDGKGFDAGILGETRGFGLVGIRERLERMGGTLELGSVPGQGTQLVALVPCAQEQTS